MDLKSLTPKYFDIEISGQYREWFSRHSLIVLEPGEVWIVKIRDIDETFMFVGEGIPLYQTNCHRFEEN